MLIYPQSTPSYVDTRKNNDTFRGLAPPLGLLYIAKMLENDGDSVEILDFSAEPFEEQKLIDAVKNADVVGMTVLSFSLLNSVEIVKVIKEIKPQIKVIIGGPHCTLFPKKALEETRADISVQGDGEAIILDIKKAITGKIDFSEISGIYYRENDEIKNGPPLKLIEDIDSIPFPIRHLVNKYNYGTEYNPNIKKGEFTSIITSRGCPFNCKFCSRNSISMKTFRRRSTKNILEEIKSLSEMGYKYVSFADDSFLENKKQAIELFEGIIKEQYGMKFIITAARVNSADEELFKKMKKAGVTHIQFGLESGNQDVLDFYNKKINLDKIRYAVNLGHNMGFFTIGSFILGAPFETKEHFEKTIQFAKSLPIDSVSFLPLRYMAGSELWCGAVKDGKILEDEYMVQADSKRGLGHFAREKIIEYCSKANRDFYLRPNFVLRLFIKSLKNDELGFLQSYLALFFSNIKQSLSFMGLTSRSK